MIPDNRDDIFNLIRDDVQSFLGGAFPIRDGDDGREDGFRVPIPFGPLLPIGTGGSTAVPWSWRGQHRETFFEVAATGKVVDVVGVTLLTEANGELQFHRVVDWLTTYRQLGLMMVCRRPRYSGEPDADDPESFLFTEALDTRDIPGVAS